MQFVVDGNVDLAGAAACGVDDEGGRGAIAAGEILVEEVEPLMLGCGAVGGSMLEQSAGSELCEHLRFDAAEDFAEVEFAGVGEPRHWPKGSLRDGWRGRV